MKNRKQQTRVPEWKQERYEARAESPKFTDSFQHVKEWEAKKFVKSIRKSLGGITNKK